MMDLSRQIELERVDAARQALEDAAKEIEAKGGGETYRKAYKATAAFLRQLRARL